MEQLTHSHAVEIHWHSYELRPKGAPPISPEYLARIQEGRPRLYATARENYGLELKPGPFGIDTRPALIGAKYAEAQNLGAAYHDRIMQAYWQQEAKLDDLEQLTTLAQDAGLDRQEFQAALSDPTYDHRVKFMVHSGTAVYHELVKNDLTLSHFPPIHATITHGITLRYRS